MLASRCNSGNIEKAKIINDSMSADALRVLAVAYKEIDEVPQSPASEELENGLRLMGLVGMIDPPRHEAKDAVCLLYTSFVEGRRAGKFKLHNKGCRK